VGPTRATVLLTGESGVGKDLIARAIHFHSPRKLRPLVKINCSALPENLMESELFGYEKGAFTGAQTTKPGKFEQADTGTVFLDEIGDVPAAIQVKLLRVLQEREFERLGSNVTRHIDIRLVAATNQDLRAALEQGTFREDLYYRLNVVPLNIPPLRERKVDVPALANHFVRKLAPEMGCRVEAITDAAMDKLVAYHWPGNVRELENVVERAVVLANDPAVPLEVLPDALLQANGVRMHRKEGGALPPDASLFEIVNDYERRQILERLEQCNWSQTEAAESLHVPLSTLNQKIKRLDIKIRRKGDEGR
jgi:transcriptional regulator with GAF, ATPase, and Fis domain